MTIKSSICVDCICLPICFGKLNYKLISECDFIKNAINNICASVIDNEYQTILFASLNREFNIMRKGAELVIEDTRFWNGDIDNVY